MSVCAATWEDMIEVSRNMRQDDWDEVMATRWDDSPYSFAADHMRLNGPKYVIRANDDSPVCVGGIAVHQPGVGQAWLVGTNRLFERRKEIWHVVKTVINHYMHKHDTPLHRIHAFSAYNHKMSHRWLEKIGFKQEAVMQSYGKHGEDFIVFSIVKGA